MTLLNRIILNGLEKITERERETVIRVTEVKSSEKKIDGCDDI